MVIRLKTGAQIGGALRYNEQKVVQKQAQVLVAMGFANNELATKNRNYTTYVLESQSRKNSNVKKPTLHFSLSLHPSERISDNTFKAIAYQFMGEMGYKDQPYIVYRHHDTAHPHIHIVTTCVDETGAKLDDAFIKRRANTVRQKLEFKFDLIKAQGRGKEFNKSIYFDSTQEVIQDEVQKKEQLEAILRQTFQQSAFGTIEEFKALLKKQQVQITLHQSEKAGKQLRGISYQLTDQSGKALSPRIKASEIGTWATWKGLKNLFDKTAQIQQEQLHPNHLSIDEYKVVAAILSDQLREYKKNQRIYYESALIENFPTAAMRVALHSLTQKKLTEAEVVEAVRRFEEYKRTRLPEIIRKEQAAFTRTMDTYTKIGCEIEGSALTKLQYFSALGVRVDQNGLLTSPINRQLMYQIEAERWLAIKSETGPDLNVPEEYSRGERTVLLLSNSKKPFEESYYDVRSEHLQRILQRNIMIGIHRQLNKNYVAKLARAAPVVEADQVRYFYQRGILVDKLQKPIGEKFTQETTYLVRYHQAPRQVAVAPDGIFGKQIPLLNTENWRRGLSTEAGRYMVALAQSIDRATEVKSDDGINKAIEITKLRKQIHQLDPGLETYTDVELVGILERRSLQGKGWIRQTELEARQEPITLMDKPSINAQLLDIRAADVFGYEQTGKFKHVGKGIKKRGKGQSRDL
ncbi:relaxase/mobilization nuclease domain-containing protein [Spirosoma luteum]|uniref:relaxase/mobilization nuclease domain-containing protein n=1 Tax=Spirosoma luteum TaxID=431553 RepID=UPI00035F3C08|nr:relaxase/mobilization nuclease domain-containing protein [Spirosoma luteum]